jgi:hypothetical protein
VKARGGTRALYSDSTVIWVDIRYSVSAADTGIVLLYSIIEHVMLFELDVFYSL